MRIADVLHSMSALLLMSGCFAGISCSSDDNSATSSPASSGAGGQGGDPTPEESCVKPGDKGNNKGVGEYCTPTGEECSGFAEAPLCLAKVGQNQWMCTRIGCNEMTDCGEGAGCLIEQAGSACVPCRCDDRGIGCPKGAGGGGAGGAGGAGGGAQGGSGGAGGS